ncbi:MAG: zinc ribbon domain-containing protein [Anaerolineae bacterium]|jgi:RNA polymerase subunit RPABC4/transcription elongation factor Spt4|nr:zinc ribbon domain-containing protein [Anaerolineae bacterium]MBT7073529.1 zinc ribbon domain-containing protein [Anaerolineae bacterium]MBT7783261.1 zinc ribbon domain-containing protein [Anaerolineae bacterium]
MNLDPNFLNNLALVLTGFGAAFLIAIWVSLIIWTYRDIRNRSRDNLVQILSTVLVGLLNLPGILVYLVLRPPHTLEDEYQRTLEEEALLAAIEDQLLCPGCERRVKDDWMLCPSCQTKLKKNCHNCDALMELPWNICPHCATPELGMRKEGMVMDDVMRNLETGDEAKDENDVSDENDISIE